MGAAGVLGGWKLGGGGVFLQMDESVDVGIPEVFADFCEHHLYLLDSPAKYLRVEPEAESFGSFFYLNEVPGAYGFLSIALGGMSYF